VDKKDYYATQEKSRFNEDVQGQVGGSSLNQCSPPQCPAPGFDENYVIAQLFTYHPANMFTQPKFETVREAAKYFARVLLNNVPAGADRTAAIRKVREAVFTANAGISLGGLSL